MNTYIYIIFYDNWSKFKQKKSDLLLYTFKNSNKLDISLNNIVNSNYMKYVIFNSNFDHLILKKQISICW